MYKTFLHVSALKTAEFVSQTVMTLSMCDCKVDENTL